jgi:4-hydroxy-4-methyl-2-oxoglutarate aldolase
MASNTALARSDFDKLRQLDTCTVSNAIEKFNVRLRNEGFISSAVRCQFPHFPAMLGYAVTARVCTSATPMEGNTYYHRTDWWNHVLAIPAPRVVVIEDVDKPPGVGSLVGKVHANILRALGCVGVVTNGAVRGLNAVEPTGFQMFAGNVSPSHAYAHIFEYGGPVEIGELRIHPGDLIHGDLHGVVTIPKEIASQIPDVAARLAEKETQLIGLCRSPDFSVEELRNLIREQG